MKSCHVMVKPTGALCNLACDYCFYLDKAHLYPERKVRCMDDETLELFVRQHIATQETQEVIFTWQGGEPTLAGLDFFQRAVAFQQQYGQGKSIVNTFQTNGILLNDEWCHFFSQHHFLIGISIDGDASLHDAFRKTSSGHATHQRVVEAIQLLKKHRVPFNTLTVVNALNGQYPLQVYEYLKKLGSRHMQFIPLLETAAEGVHERSVSPALFGNFLKMLFYHWIRRDIGEIEIPFFEHTFSAYCGLPPLTCIFAATCGNAFALELNGDIYLCDHFVDKGHLAGNIHQQTIKEVLDGDAAQAFGAQKRPTAPECHRCKVKFACNGGCPKDRIALSSRGLPELNYFCASYQSFFKYSEPYILIMKNLQEQGYTPSDIRHYLAE